MAERLKEEFARQLEAYNQAASEPAQSSLLAQMEQTIKKLEAEKNKIQDFSAALRENEAAMNQALAVRQKRIDDIANKIVKLETENQRLAQMFDPAGEFTSRIKSNDNEIALYQQQLDNPLQDVIEKEEAEIIKATEGAKKTKEKQFKSTIMRALFAPPQTWLDLQKKLRAQPAIGKKSKEEMDFTGLVANDAQKPQIDLTFLPFDAFANIARFSADDLGAYQTFTADREGAIALMKKVNGMMKFNPKINFNSLMDVATGKIKRKPGDFAPNSPTQFFQNSVETPGIETDYAGLLKRSQNHFFHQDEKALESYCKERGIEIKKTGGQYYDYKRNIDLSYLTPEQWLNLATFFATKEKEFLTPDGVANQVLLQQHINDVFTKTGLSYEELMTITAGHLIRQPGKYAKVDPRFALFDVTKQGAAPDANHFIAQRRVFLEEKKRKEEAERQRLAEEKAQAQEAIVQAAAALPIEPSSPASGSESPLSAVSAAPSPLSSADSSPRAELPRASVPEMPEKPPVPLPASPLSVKAMEPAAAKADVPAIPVMAAAAGAPLLALPSSSQDRIRPSSLRLSRHGAPAEGKTTTGLGLDKAALVNLKNSNAPAHSALLLEKQETKDQGRHMEAIYQAVSFLLSPDTTKMTELFEKAHRRSVWFSGRFADPISETELKELQEFCMQLNFTGKLNNDDPRQFQTLLGLAAHKTTTVQLDWLTKIKEMPHLRVFLDQVNQKTEREPYYKLLVLKGYLYHLQAKYGEGASSMKYKMGAVCQHLLDTIDQTSLVNVPPEQKQAVQAFLNPERCKAEYDKFAIDFAVNKKEDEALRKARDKPRRY